MSIHSFTDNLLYMLYPYNPDTIFTSSHEELRSRCAGEQFGRVCPRIFCNGRFLGGSDQTPLSNLELGDSPLQCLPSNLALKSKRSSAPKSAPKKRDEEKVSWASNSGQALKNMEEAWGTILVTRGFLGYLRKSDQLLECCPHGWYILVLNGFNSFRTMLVPTNLSLESGHFQVRQTKQQVAFWGVRRFMDNRCLTIMSCHYLCIM